MFVCRKVNAFGLSATSATVLIFSELDRLWAVVVLVVVKLIFSVLFYSILSTWLQKSSIDGR